MTLDNAGNGGVVLTDPTNGIATITFSEAFTETLSEGCHAFDVFLTLGGNDTQVVRLGDLDVLPAVTQLA